MWVGERTPTCKVYVGGHHYRSFQSYILPPTDHGGLVKPSSADILFLVFHGGSALDSRKDTISKDIDFQTLHDNFTNLLGLHFPSAVGRVALRIVPCVDVCCQALELLSQVCA